jgi:alkylated DNA nucleotide flippase Atl1
LRCPTRKSASCARSCAPIPLEMQPQLSEYFDFQKSVWKALLAIPFGETRSYGEIARQVGRPTASRAGEWKESDRHHCAVSSRHWLDQKAHRHSQQPLLAIEGRPPG